MATVKSKTAAEVKLTPTQMRKKIEELEEEIRVYKEDTAWCYLCGKPKKKDKFYFNSDPMNKSGVSPICKDCAKKIALRVDANGEEHEATMESVKLALRYLNKPFYNDLWDSSVNEANNLTHATQKTSPWTAYAKNVGMKQYLGDTYFDSDFFKEKIVYDDEKTPDQAENLFGKLDYDDYIKNKEDVKRLLGYDPFIQEPLMDQPLLYAQLIGMLDSGGDENDDMIRNASSISIVRAFLQQAKLDNTITQLMGDIKSIEKNSATIKSLQDSKQKLTSMITNLAAESCISLKNNKNAKKGENTWTGKIKKLKELNLREAEVNGFDIGTCRGMQQVLEMSDSSIMKQLALDESEWSDMVAEQRKMLVDVQNERDLYREVNRILLRENLDLRDTLEEEGLLDKDRLKDLKALFSPFAEIEQEKDKISEEKSDDIEDGDDND